MFSIFLLTSIAVNASDRYLFEDNPKRFTMGKPMIYLLMTTENFDFKKMLFERDKGLYLDTNNPFQPDKLPYQYFENGHLKSGIVAILYDEYIKKNKIRKLNLVFSNERKIDLGNMTKTERSKEPKLATYTYEINYNKDGWISSLYSNDNEDSKYQELSYSSKNGRNIVAIKEYETPQKKQLLSTQIFEYDKNQNITLYKYSYAFSDQGDWYIPYQTEEVYIYSNEGNLVSVERKDNSWKNVDRYTSSTTIAEAEAKSIAKYYTKPAIVKDLAYYNHGIINYSREKSLLCKKVYDLNIMLNNDIFLKLEPYYWTRQIENKTDTISFHLNSYSNKNRIKFSVLHNQNSRISYLSREFEYTDTTTKILVMDNEPCIYRYEENFYNHNRRSKNGLRYLKRSKAPKLYLLDYVNEYFNRYDHYKIYSMTREAKNRLCYNQINISFYSLNVDSDYYQNSFLEKLDTNDLWLTNFIISKNPDEILAKEKELYQLKLDRSVQIQPSLKYNNLAATLIQETRAQHDGQCQYAPDSDFMLHFNYFKS